MVIRPPCYTVLAGLLLLLLVGQAAAAPAGERPAGGPPAWIGVSGAPIAGQGHGLLAAVETAAQRPGPEVTRPAGRPDGAVGQALGTGMARSPGGRESGTAPHGPRGGRGDTHRGPRETDPVPYAAPTRPADGQNGAPPGGRGRRDAPSLPAPVTDGADAPDPVLLLRFLLVLGFRRVRPANVLEHPLRRAVHAAIRDDPGLDLAGCAAATGANRETVRYHLALLVCCGKVAEETRSGSVRFFPHDPALTPVRRALLHALRNKSLAPMLAAIREAPGLSRQELADRLCVAGPSVTRQVQRLVEDGLVIAERSGRSTCYRLTPGCLSAIDPAFTASIGDGQVRERASA